MLKSLNSKSESHKLGTSSGGSRTDRELTRRTERMNSRKQEWTRRDRLHLRYDNKEEKERKGKKKEKKEKKRTTATSRRASSARWSKSLIGPRCCSMACIMDFQRYSLRGLERRGRFRGWEVGGGKRSGARVRERWSDDRSERVRGEHVLGR